jgi:hypothetical protein
MAGVILVLDLLPDGVVLADRKDAVSRATHRETW